MKRFITPTLGKISFEEVSSKARKNFTASNSVKGEGEQIELLVSGDRTRNAEFELRYLSTSVWVVFIYKRAVEGKVFPVSVASFFSH